MIGHLQATPYFASVKAVLDTEHAEIDADGTAIAPVLLSVRERAAHRLSFGMGASSNTGARVEAAYQTPNFFNQAWEFNSGLRLEQKKQTLYGDVFLPPDARQRRHSIGAMVDASDIEGLKTSRYAFGAQSVQQRGSIEQRLSLSWQEEIRDPEGASRVTSRALVPNVQWTWRHVDDLFNPRDGWVLNAQLGGGVKGHLVGTDLNVGDGLDADRHLHRDRVAFGRDRSRRCHRLRRPGGRACRRGRGGTRSPSGCARRTGAVSRTSCC